MSELGIYKSAAGRQAIMARYEEALGNWALPYETKRIATRHGETFVIASGDPAAPPLLLLHGAGTNSAIWAGDVGEYGRFYHTYAADLPGEPGKSSPNRPPWEGPAFAEWVEDLLDGLGIETAAIVGISQGGWTALKFAAAHPERTTKLVLICPGGVVPDRVSFILRAIPLSLLGKWGTRPMTRLLFGDRTPPEGVIEIMTLINRHFKPRLGVLPLFSDDELARLTMPVFLLGGDKDAMRDTVKIAARLERVVPHLKVEIAPGGGHALLDTAVPILDFLTAPTPA
jgi:pimeloyl-ACP methyl ester carboxylesterase